MYDDYTGSESCFAPSCPECGEDDCVEDQGGGEFYCTECDHTWEEDDGPCSEDLIDGVGFADPGGVSALRAATPNNPRNLPCPTCEQPNRLTPADVRNHYQCDECAQAQENGF